MSIVKVLYVEDDEKNRNDLKELLSDSVVSGMTVCLECEASFEKAIERSKDYHLLILDLFQGPATNGGLNLGEKVFDTIRNSIFIPIVFYSGNTLSVRDLRSQVVGVVSKGEDNELDVLKSEMGRLISSGIPTLREKVHNEIDAEFNRYFWGIIQEQNNIFKAGEEDFSLGYLLLRKFADSLSKENIKEILHDNFISTDKVHPMEFYIYPTEISREYECGEIIKNKDSKDVYVVLTPSCDFIKRTGKQRKAEHVLLARTVLLNSRLEYTSILDLNAKIAETNKSINELAVEGKTDEDLQKKAEELVKTRTKKIGSFKQFVNSGNSDRYFFLPGTPFIEDRVIDFQDKLMVSYESLKNDFDRLAKLDDPYAQSMHSSFIRYYNRIGFPDIDADYIIKRLGL